MANVSFEHIKGEIGFSQTLNAVRSIWYKIAEGWFQPQTPYYKELVSQELQKHNIRNGWVFRIMDHGDVDFQFYHEKENMTVQVYKNRFGKEMIQAFVGNR